MPFLSPSLPLAAFAAAAITAGSVASFNASTYGFPSGGAKSLILDTDNISKATMNFFIDFLFFNILFKFLINYLDKFILTLLLIVSIICIYLYFLMNSIYTKYKYR